MSASFYTYSNLMQMVTLDPIFAPNLYTFERRLFDKSRAYLAKCTNTLVRAKEKNFSQENRERRSPSLSFP